MACPIEPDLMTPEIDTNLLQVFDLISVILMSAEAAGAAPVCDVRP